MDFLDPQKSRRQAILLITGYVLIAIAILFGTTILLYEAYGFGLNKQGQVIQNGLLFVSSQPSPANIYVDSKLNKAKTDSRIILPAGTYNVKLQRSGYRDWQRSITVEGGKVDHFDYPFLFPTNLTTTAKQNYDTAPALLTQSLDKRWLLAQIPGSDTDFQLFDLKNPKQDPTAYTIPAGVFTAPTATPAVQSWQVLEWANDNKHILVKHSYDDTYEYLLLDRSDASQSVNLTTTLGENPTELTLLNERFDHYVLYDATDKTLKTANLGQPTPAAYVNDVLAYKTYGDTTVLYATPDTADASKVKIILRQGSKTYSIRSAPAGTTYLLNLTKYSGDLMVAAGATSENKVIVYRNPADQITNPDTKVAVPVQVLRATNPNYLEFSANARFIVAEGGNSFAIYDNEDAKGFSYQTSQPLDAPQLHASWMDGHRLQYVSGGKLVVFDYDDRNLQTLVPALPQYEPAYNAAYNTLYTLAPQAKDASKAALTSTSLLIPADQ